MWVENVREYTAQPVAIESSTAQQWQATLTDTQSVLEQETSVCFLAAQEKNT
jgi:hypothetical protein